MGLPKCHLQNDQHSDDDHDDHDDDDDNDDDDEIAPDAKVSFFSVLWFPPVKCLKSDNSGGPLRCPAPCFCFWFFILCWFGAPKNYPLPLLQNIFFFLFGYVGK